MPLSDNARRLHARAERESKMTRDIIAEKLGIDWSHDMTWNVNAVRLCKLIWELEEKASRDSRTLSAVPSELLSVKCQLIIDETASPKQFKDDKTGAESYSRAVYELMIARDCFEEYEEQRGIAG